MIYLCRGAMAYYNLVMHYGGQEFWVDNVDEDLYSYVELVADVYKLIDKRNIGLTISCDSIDFLLRMIIM